MLIRLYVSDKAREHQIAQAFCEGAHRFGHRTEVCSTGSYTAPDPAIDIAVMVGVKGISGRCFHDFRAAGRRIILIDKGYCRHPDPQQRHYFRLSVDAPQPLAYLQRRPHDAQRRLHLPWTIRPRRSSGRHIIFAGSSEKYCRFHALGDATAYADAVIQQLKRDSDRPIVYRPKPSWVAAVPIAGSLFSRPPRTLGHELHDAYALVTHGSNAALEAILAGVPCIVLGDGIARPMSRTTLADINDLYYPPDHERLQWLADVAHCQFTLPEFSQGLAWDSIQDLF